MPLASPALSGIPAVYGADIYASDAIQQFELGAIGYAYGGNKVFRYAKAGGVDLVRGMLTVSAAILTNHENQTVAAAAAIDALEVDVNVGATAVTKDQYLGGELVVNDSTGEGTSYHVRGNAALDSSGNGFIYLYDPILVALVADTSEISLIANPWKGILKSVADQGDMCVGVPNAAITLAEYGWVQTRGLCSVLADETIAIGLSAAIGSSTVGAAETKDVDDAFGDIGVAHQAGVDEEYRALYLRID